MSVAAPSLTFVGDLVAPAWNVPHLAGFRAWLAGSLPVANLEGPIVPDFGRAKPRSDEKFNLASVPAALAALGPAIVTIANNHYEDFAEIVPPPDVTVIGDRAGPPVLGTLGGRPVAMVGIDFPATDPLRWRGSRRIAIAEQRVAQRKAQQRTIARTADLRAQARDEFRIIHAAIIARFAAARSIRQRRAIA